MRGVVTTLLSLFMVLTAACRLQVSLLVCFAHVYIHALFYFIPHHLFVARPARSEADTFGYR